MVNKAWVGQTVKIEGEAHLVVDQKYGPMLTKIKKGSHDFPLARTIKLKVKPGKGSAFWLPPMEYCEPEKSKALQDNSDE